MKIQIFLAKRVLGFGFWEAAKQGFNLSMIFKFYKQVLILSKSFENLLFFKNNLKFMKTIGLFCARPQSSFIV